MVCVPPFYLFITSKHLFCVRKILSTNWANQHPPTIKYIIIQKHDMYGTAIECVAWVSEKKFRPILKCWLGTGRLTGRIPQKYRYIACNTHEHSAKKRGVDEIMGKKYIMALIILDRNIYNLIDTYLYL